MALGPGAITVHASAVAFDGRGCLITGAAGSGKSTLAIEMIALGAELIADDRTVLSRQGDVIEMNAPETVAGKLEARGVGLIAMPARAAPLVLIVDLDSAAAERLPAPRSRDVLGLACPIIAGRGRAGLAAIMKLTLLHGLCDPDAPVGE